MGSELNSSFTNLSVDESLTSDTTDLTDAASQSSKTRGIAAIATREHCRQPGPNEPEKQGKNRLFYCKYCTDVYRTQASNTFRSHLAKVHGIAVVEGLGSIHQSTVDQLERLYSKASSAGEALRKIDSQVFRKVLDKEVITEALATLVLSRNLSFRVVEWPEFHAFCQTLNPEVEGYITTAHSEIRKKIKALYDCRKDSIRKSLQSSISKVHLAVDVWSSPNRHLLLGICAHFVAERGTDTSRLLIGLRTIPSHAGEEQFTALKPVIEDFGIAQKIGSIISDNASTNDTLCSAISDYLEEKDVPWDENTHRIRCIGHIINLTVQSFLFHNFMGVETMGSFEEQEITARESHRRAIEAIQKSFRVMGPLGKLHNIVVFVRASSGRTQAFIELVGRLVPLDNRTRWNSWTSMCNVALQHESKIDEFCKANWAELKDDFLSPLDWQKIRTIQTFLVPFQEATLYCQGHKATIDFVLLTMDVLLAHLKEALDEFKDDKEMSSRIKSSWATLDKYYTKTDDSPLYAAGIILHPNRRTKYIQINWPASWQKSAISSVKNLWRSYRDSAHLLALPSYDVEANQATKKPLTKFCKIAQNLQGYSRPRSLDEFDDYCNQEPYDLGDMSAIEWWLQDPQRKRFPRLSIMAIDILSIPAMSDEPERVFSGARRTISWDRAQLSASTIEMLECIKSWHRNS